MGLWLYRIDLVKEWKKAVDEVLKSGEKQWLN